MTKTFPRELRLLTPSAFQNVFNKAESAASRPLTLLGRKNHLAHPRLGITVAKKQIRKAHSRNEAKRLLRENFRLTQNQLPCVDIVAIVKRDFDTLNNHQRHKLINTQLLRLIKKLC
jgi:ribonuclease P protein component